jgi:hypothetical protein
MNSSSIAHSIAMPPISPGNFSMRERILPDYTLQGRSTIPSRGSIADKSVYKTEYLRLDEGNSHEEGHMQKNLKFSSRLKESPLNECQDRNEVINFYLKIPSKEFRPNREHSKEILQGFIPVLKKTTKRKRKRIIESLLLDFEN